MKVFAPALISFIICGCTPQIAPHGPLDSSPLLLANAFLTTDGLQLPMRRWLPRAEPVAVVVAVHGFNDYSKAYDLVPGAPGVGPTLASQGYAVYAYDQRGFGAAPYNGLWPGIEKIKGDFTDFVFALDAFYPNLPIYAIGVSMGGAVIITSMTSDNAPPIDRIVLVAPAVWGKNTMPLFYRASLWLGAHTVPWLKPSGRGLSRRASDNIEMLRDNSHDPLFIKETRIDSIYGLTNLMEEAQKNTKHIPVPTLYLYGAKDEIIPKNATILALKKLLQENEPRRFAYYQDSWHMMLRDLQANLVLMDISSYFGDRSAPLPSGAEDGAFERLERQGK